MATMLLLPPAVDAAFPGRDGLIAFTRAVGSKPGQIYVVRPNGNGMRQLTHRRRGADAPAWSPDGRRITFNATGQPGGTQVFVKRLGGGVRQITHGKGTFHHPGWSPNGRRIVATHGRWDRHGQYHNAVVVMRANGRRRHTVYGGGDLTLSYPAWSPDGRSIAFVQTDTDLQGADPNIYVVPAGGGRAQLITGFRSQEHPDWSPDGSLIAYTWGFGLGPDDIRVLRPDGTGDRRVTDDISVPDGWPVWAPSGRRLAIGRLGRIWTIAPDGSGLRQLTHGSSTASDWDASWQPRPKQQGRGGRRLRRGGRTSR